MFNVIAFFHSLLPVLITSTVTLALCLTFAMKCIYRRSAARVQLQRQQHDLRQRKALEREAAWHGNRNMYMR